MDFHKQYRSMNENITPSDALVQQTIAKMESGKMCIRDSITEQFDPVFFFFCAGATTVYFFAVWIGASIFLKDKSCLLYTSKCGRFVIPVRGNSFPFAFNITTHIMWYCLQKRLVI